ncbi:hypothetical protein AZF37_01375 [endosymbiont 'TC1' of Trimyema compressum]|uniref:helix-turn-helix domain-containing protein n=1 Tax=endosymbiont 'TC1' of Trimyema compressum TaxID=243899 RepID=UPI0007F05DB6|nr:helix-turn-helix transcriptional regulator [endosymbiont 'TC1' of Trimyema compressum]AMP20005.1 hypothetical protein AZF37_01375 [endosymbiont 'TC1' of Trimyema compressum]
MRKLGEVTQAELASYIGVSKGSIGFYEKAERTPDIEVLAKIADFFGVTLEYLLGWSDNLFRENLDAGNQLKLSDTAIVNIFCLDEENYNLKRLFNHFLESKYFFEFMFALNDYCTGTYKKYFNDGKDYVTFHLTKIIELFNDIFNDYTEIENTLETIKLCEEMGCTIEEYGHKNYENKISKLNEYEKNNMPSLAEIERMYLLPYESEIDTQSHKIKMKIRKKYSIILAVLSAT